MKQLFRSIKKKINSKNKVLVVLFIVFLIGLISGSLYITILNNNDKLLILNKVSNYIKNMAKITTENKIEIFKKTFINNLIYFSSMWVLGISIIGIPIILIMTFFKSFTIGFSISSIYAKYKLKSFIAILIYLLPNNLLTATYTIILAVYSINLSINLLFSCLKKKTLNFNTFIGKYFLLLLISIILSFIISIIEAFVVPNLYNMFY